MGASFRNVIPAYMCEVVSHILTISLFLNIRSGRSRPSLALTSSPSAPPCLRTLKTQRPLSPRNSTLKLVNQLTLASSRRSTHLNIVSFVWVAAKADPIPKISFVDNEPEFRWALLADQMAFDKLHEGIVKFAADAVILKGILKKKLEN